MIFYLVCFTFSTSYSVLPFHLVYVSQFLCLFLLFILSSAVAQSHPTLWPHGLQHTRLPCLSPTPKACSNHVDSFERMKPSHHLILCYLLLLLPAIFPSIRVLMSQFFTSGGQNIGASASVSVLPMNIQYRTDFL